MKRLTKSLSNWRAVTLSISVLILGAVSVMVASGAGATSNPSGIASENAPAPGTSGVVTSGPELQPEDADALARSFAATQGGDTAPSSQIAVKTDRGSADVAVMPQSQLPDTAPQTLKSWDQASVYVETLRGHFTLANAPVPHGQPNPSGDALTLIIDAHTGQVSSISLTNEAPSQETLERIGSVRRVEDE